MRVIPIKLLIACGILCLWLSAGTAWAAEVNVALGKPASASSIWEAASTADKAVDGVTNLGHPNHLHSGGGDLNPWFRVELGQEYLLKKIVIWNRVDCCQDRLQNITVRVLGPDDIVLFETLLYPGGTTGAVIPASVEVPLGTGVPGTAVRVSRSPSPAMSGDNAYLLGLAEVEVIADVPPGVSGAYSPSPAVNATRVGTGVADLAKAAVTFGWNAAVTGDSTDPNILVVDPKLVSHKLYLSNGTNDPNVFLAATVPAGNPVQATVQYGPVELNRSATYFWRVDEIRLNNSVEETIAGALWKFQTESNKPIIMSITPASQFAWSVESAPIAGEQAESASFTVQAENPYSKDATGMAYAWYKVNAGGDVKVAEGSATFTIPTVQNADAGQYYCVVTLANPATGTTAKSANATLSIKHILGRWPFDGDYADTVAGNNGTEVGGPLPFVPGIVPATGGPGQAVEFKGLGTQSVRVPSTMVNGTQSWSFSFWEYTNSALAAGYMMGCGAGSGAERLYVWRREGTDPANGNTDYYGNLNVAVAGSLGPLNAEISRFEWHQNCWAFNGNTGVYTWYVDGIPYGSATVPQTWPGFDAPFSFGNRQNLQRPFTGFIDDFRLFDYTMEAREVAENYLEVKGGYFCWTPVANDLNGDCVISIADLALMAANWTDCNLVPASACQ